MYKNFNSLPSILENGHFKMSIFEKGPSPFEKNIDFVAQSIMVTITKKHYKKRYDKIL